MANRAHRHRRSEHPANDAVGPGLKIREGGAKVALTRPVRLENPIQRGRVQRVVVRGAAQRRIDRRHPVRAEQVRYRPAVSLASQIRGEELLDGALFCGVQLDLQRAGDPLHLPVPVVEQVRVVHEHPLHPAGVPLGQQVVFEPQRTRELRRGRHVFGRRRDHLLRVAHGDNCRHVEPDSARRLEPQAGQGRDPRFLDHHQRRRRQRG